MYSVGVEKTRAMQILPILFCWQINSVRTKTNSVWNRHNIFRKYRKQSTNLSLLADANNAINIATKYLISKIYPRFSFLKYLTVSILIYRDNIPVINIKTKNKQQLNFIVNAIKITSLKVKKLHQVVDAVLKYFL